MKVLICDDDRLLAELLAGVLHARGHEVRVALEPTEAVAAASGDAPDVCLMDLGFRSVAETTDEAFSIRAIRHLAGLGVRVAVLSGSGHDELRRRCLDAGASDYLLKGGELSLLLAAVEAPLDAGRRADRAEPVVRPGRAPWTRASLADFLTPRERAVLEGLVCGESTKRLAVRLGVRPATARTHVQNLLGKLCVHSRLEAVSLAVEHQLVPVQSDPDA